MVRKAIWTLWAVALISKAGDQRPPDIYRSIAERNAFGLKDAPAPVQAQPTNAAPQPAKKEDFYLTGISTIGNTNRPKAYLMSKDLSKKDYDQKYYTLSVGDKKGDVTLKQIDEKGRRVLIAYGGEEKWLSMQDNGVPAPTSAPAVNALPLIPGAPGAIPPPPAVGNAPSGEAATGQQALNYTNNSYRNRHRAIGPYNGVSTNTTWSVNAAGAPPPLQQVYSNLDAVPAPPPLIDPNQPAPQPTEVRPPPLPVF
jgi:hypothetical protein